MLIYIILENWGNFPGKNCLDLFYGVKSLLDFKEFLGV
jgi:hypothetical protein